MLSFNTNLLIPSNASLYITIRDELHTLNMVQIVTIKSQGEEGGKAYVHYSLENCQKDTIEGEKKNPTS